MIMKKIVNYVLLVVMALCSVQAFAAKKEKAPKKETAPYVWDWDGVKSGNETMDEYLVDVTKIWNEIEEYEKTYAQYTYNIDTMTINDKYYLLAYMTDAEGNLVTRSQVNWQVYNSVLAGTNIVLDATNASLGTATASLALAEMGLNAIAYAKYIKGGPMVIAKGMKEIGAIAKINKANAKSWKAMKTAAIDPATLGCFSEETCKKMNKCCFLKEVVESDPEYQAIESVQSAKSPEELKAETDKIGNAFAEATVLPEDANQSLDDESFDGLDTEDA